MNNLIFRYAEKSDYTDLKKLYKDIFDLEISKKNYEKYLQDKTHTIILALCDEKICGSLCIERVWDAFKDETIFFLKNVGVAENWRRHGICTKLFKVVRELAIKENIKSIELTSADFRTEAHNFYLKQNFSKKKTTVFIWENTYEGSQIR